MNRANNRESGNFVPTSISWHNIEVFTKSKKKYYYFGEKSAQKQIINKISGEVRAGQFLAIMGSSGAGKTSLLNVLTARNLSKVDVKGIVKLNGRAANASQIAFVSAYVQQNDLFIPMLTVREHLLFQAFLRLDQSLTKQEICVRVDQIMQEFSLTKCSETRIGSSTTFKGISGGESKRLAFASEVLTNPSILFCDEPTSGLDSYMAENIVNVLKSMASQGRTVICTIHQPSSQVFDLFEKLLLMADGRVAFMGNRDDAFDFFESQQMQISDNFNPADLYIKQLSITPGNEVECRKQIHTICDNYLNTSYAKQLVTNGLEESRIYESASPLKTNRKYNAGIWRQFTALLWRAFLSNLRDPKITRTRLIQAIVFSIIIGVIFYDQLYTQVGALNMNGAMYCLLVNLSLMASLAVNILSESFQLFMREHQNRMYRVFIYFITNVLIQIPIFTIIPIVFGSIYYFLVGLNAGGSQFVLHLVIAVLMTNCAVSFAYLISSITSNGMIAASIATPITLPLTLFGGFYMNDSTFPLWLFWIKYISWYNYAFEAMIINQWKNIDHILCNSNINATIGTNITQTTTAISTESDYCLDNGLAVIKYYDFDENKLLFDIILLIVYSLVLQILAFIGLTVKTKLYK